MSRYFFVQKVTDVSLVFFFFVFLTRCESSQNVLLSVVVRLCDTHLVLLLPMGTDVPRSAFARDRKRTPRTTRRARKESTRKTRKKRALFFLSEEEEEEEEEETHTQQQQQQQQQQHAHSCYALLHTLSLSSFKNCLLFNFLFW